MIGFQTDGKTSSRVDRRNAKRARSLKLPREPRLQRPTAGRSGCRKAARVGRLRQDVRQMLFDHRLQSVRDLPADLGVEVRGRAENAQHSRDLGAPRIRLRRRLDDHELAVHPLQEDQRTVGLATDANDVLGKESIWKLLHVELAAHLNSIARPRVRRQRSSRANALHAKASSSGAPKAKPSICG